MRVSIILLLLVCVTFCQESSLTIHGIAHSHNDAGWLMSFEKYYNQYTKHILDHVVEVLVAQPDKIFHWSDMAFFEYWWQRQAGKVRSQVYTLVEEKRLVFIGGGWVMNDEALPAYKESLLQMRTGLDFLRDTFGVRPTIGWQIDPFGSSALTVAVLSKLGYDAIVENRVSLDYKKKLGNEDGFNFYWQGHQVDEEHEDSLLFAHLLTDHYNIFKVWNENMALGQNVEWTRKTIFETEVSPPVSAIKALTNNEAKDVNSMV